jgi:hypothetical protein
VKAIPPALLKSINDAQCVLLLWALGTTPHGICRRLGLSQAQVLDVLGYHIPGKFKRIPDAAKEAPGRPGHP